MASSCQAEEEAVPVTEEVEKKPTRKRKRKSKKKLGPVALTPSMHLPVSSRLGQFDQPTNSIFEMARTLVERGEKVKALKVFLRVLDNPSIEGSYRRPDLNTIVQMLDLMVLEQFENREEVRAKVEQIVGMNIEWQA